jgi:hypothetical protein
MYRSVCVRSSALILIVAARADDGCPSNASLPLLSGAASLPRGGERSGTVGAQDEEPPMTMQPHATPNDYRAALDGLVFPAAKDAVLRYANDRGGIDHEVADVIGQLPERDFVSAHDLEAALRAIYLASGVPPTDVPIKFAA